MKKSIRIVGCLLLAAALSSPAWAKNTKSGGGGGEEKESQAGGLPGLEERVEADEALITTLQGQVATLIGEVATLTSEVGTLTTEVNTLTTEVNDLLGQNNFAQVTPDCALGAHSSSVVSTTDIGPGECEVTFSKDVAGCSAVATIVGAFGEVAVSSTTKTNTGDSWTVSTDVPAGTPTDSAFNLTVTCP